MIIWLASYPRSGNTLLRQILKQVFEQNTYSAHNDSPVLDLHEEVSSLVGHANYAEPWNGFYNNSRYSPELTIVKTHMPPLDAGKAIFVVRDGRAALVSYFHLLHDFRGRIETTLAKVIQGHTPFGSWSDHLDAWQPLNRPDTLLLRFEDLRDKPDKCISLLARFTELRPRNEWCNPLNRLHTVMPEFFRKGCNATNMAELRNADEDLFWKFHREWMEKLGYI